MADKDDDDYTPDGPAGPYGQNPYDYPETQAPTQAELNQSRPAVAAAPGRMLIYTAVALIIGLFVIYKMFFTKEEVEVTQESKVEAERVARSELPAPPPTDIEVPDVPDEPIAEPAPPPLPEPVFPDINVNSTAPSNEEVVKRRQSEMLIMNGSKQPAAASGARSSDNLLMDAANPNSAFATQAANSSAARVKATHVGNLNNLVLQGKIIHTVMETAVNTSLPGPLRAIVTRDVYAESGREVMVPKGSRVIGSYNTGLTFGQDRVFIIWSRIIRPDGVDIKIASPGVDNLGRAGAPGFVDNRYWEIFSGAVLTSIVTIGTGLVIDSVEDDNQTTTTNTDGSTTSTGSASTQAYREAASNLGETGKTVLQRLLDLRPLITIDQGTPVNIFVNQDLEFPPDVLNRVSIIQ